MSDMDQQALQRLLEYIDDEREERCRLIIDEAEAAANSVLRDARVRARQVVHRVVAAERLRHAKAQQKIQADVQMRMRRAWFRLVIRELDQAWPDLREAVIAHWYASPDNRLAWLHSTLEVAAHSLGPGLWRVEHPQDWQMLEGAPVFRVFKDQHEALQIHCEPEAHLAGFRVSCGDVSVSTTVDGLFARKARIEGLWLAVLHRKDVLTLPASKAVSDE